MAKFKPQTDPLSEEEIQEQTRFRIEKLKALQAEGKDPHFKAADIDLKQDTDFWK